MSHSGNIRNFDIPDPHGGPLGGTHRVHDDTTEAIIRITSPPPEATLQDDRFYTAGSNTRGWNDTGTVELARSAIDQVHETLRDGSREISAEQQEIPRITVHDQHVAAIGLAKVRGTLSDTQDAVKAARKRAKERR